MPAVDAIKAIASQCIVLHHLAWYGPLSDAARDIAPAPLGWLSDYARIAVQCFLVVAGFLAARALAPAGVPATVNPLVAVALRYRRLVVPYLAAIGLAVLCAAIARAWSADDTIPAAPTLLQLAAHALLLQDVLDYDALSAGVWYVAIDLQLFALLAALLWLARGLSRTGEGRKQAAMVLVAVFAGASLLYFNLDEAWDPWGIYFFGAYALGALAWWVSSAERPRLAVAALGAIGIVALMFDFRLRIAVALATALLLAVTQLIGPRGRPAAVVAFLARISYALFLVHYPVSLVVNAAFDRMAPGNAVVGAAGMLFAWAVSIAAAAVFHRHVECRALGRSPRAAIAVPARSA